MDRPPGRHRALAALSILAELSITTLAQSPAHEEEGDDGLTGAQIAGICIVCVMVVGFICGVHSWKSPDGRPCYGLTLGTVIDWLLCRSRSHRPPHSTTPPCSPQELAPVLVHPSTPVNPLTSTPHGPPEGDGFDKGQKEGGAVSEPSATPNSTMNLREEYSSPGTARPSEAPCPQTAGASDAAPPPSTSLQEAME
eukprot:Sspe_Gene.69248::Locus_40818_Transcript_2_2_Confidence_0.667_Length_742::g.69248::m.69248